MNAELEFELSETLKKRDDIEVAKADEQKMVWTNPATLNTPYFR